jgi:LacI family transcriptional regulator
MKPQLARTRLIDVADAAGVSIATASRALSGTPGVSEPLARRVRDKAAELGYAANLHARSLASGSTSTIGLVVHEIGDPYFSEIASGVLRIAAEQGRTVQICHTGRDPEVELQQIRSLVANRVGAIVVAGSGFEDPAVELPARQELERFSASGGRVAVIGRHHLGVDAVLPANVDGGRAVAEHVLGLGHRRIAVLTGSTGLTTVADRLSGVREALAAAGVAAHEVPVIEAEFTRAGGRAGTRRLLEGHPGTTAVIALNDDMAIGCLSELRASGVTVPAQLSVSGFDDVAVAGDLSPALTTVRLPMVEMGARAVELTLKEPGKRPRRQRVPAELVVRDSTGPAPA